MSMTPTLRSSPIFGYAFDVKGQSGKAAQGTESKAEFNFSIVTWQDIIVVVYRLICIRMEDIDWLQYDRLGGVYKEALMECDQEIKQWNKCKSDYNAVLERLQTLPHEVSYDIMVPMGSLAFMPGKLIHTNEIMVLLGDDWFVIQSAKQACEIIERRRKNVNENLLRLHEQKKLLESRAGFMDSIRTEMESEDIVEIREEYDASQIVKQKDERKGFHQIYSEKKENGDKQGKIIEEQKVTHFENSCEIEDSEIWARLEELQVIEDEQGELTRIKEPDFERREEDKNEQKGFNFPFENVPPKTKRVSWKLQATESEDSEEDPCKTITFSSTKIPPTTSSVEKDSSEAFSGTVIERSEPKESSNTAPPRRLSRFRAATQRKL
ncbi:unconventional prefoldin RPB5 interactor-like isoform X2 [Ptychodera flava]|uniref:unconventional prefoldin RPB5 interactor-like isoform X2 n=1 Tax=Ptychodera flava TaxID=63121 RepID=UPI00396A7AB8